MVVERNNRLNIDEVLQKVIKALESLEYVEVVINVQSGTVTFVDRYERERVG